MNIHESAEDYLEKILMLSRIKEHVRAIDISNDMNFSRASVSRAMKNLKTDGYLLIEENGDIVLSDKGLVIADRMLRRHVILTDFFRSIGIAPEIAATDACKIEHDLSMETFEALEKIIEKLEDQHE